VDLSWLGIYYSTNSFIEHVYLQVGKLPRAPFSTIGLVNPGKAIRFNLGYVLDQRPDLFYLLLDLGDILQREIPHLLYTQPLHVWQELT
jgi:hypothetical protein